MPKLRTHLIRGGAALGISWALLGACIITTDPQFEPPAGDVAKGLMMCAECWDREFCLNSDTGEFVGPLGENDPCPEGNWMRSALAKRVVSLDGPKVGQFHCIVPDGKDVAGPPEVPMVNPNGTFCPAENPEFQFVDICQDIPINCRRPPHIAIDDLSACAEEQLPADTDPACDLNAPVDAYRTTCASTAEGAGEQNAVFKLVQTAAVFGLDPPSNDDDGPQRYCWLSCVVETGGDCDPELLDPPGIRAGSIVATIDPSESSAQLTAAVSGVVFSDDLPIDGRIVIDLPASCREPSAGACAAAVPLVEARGIGDVTLGPLVVSNVELMNAVVLPSTAVTGVGRTSLSLPSDMIYFLSGDFGDARIFRNFDTGGAPVALGIDWEARSFEGVMAFEDPTGASAMTLTLRGSLPNLPPLASAGGNQTLECADPPTLVTVSASASTDPDGVEDLTSFVWTALADDTRRSFNGVTWTTPVGVGTHSFTVNVSDASAATDPDTAKITVVDTQAPAISLEHLESSCLWPPNHDLLLFRLHDELVLSAEDACDASPSVRILSVVSNQPTNGGGDGNTTPDVLYGSGAFCVRAERTGKKKTPREYTVTLGASDASGNETLSEFVIQVPHDLGHAPPGCGTPATLTAVAATDPRCTADAP